MNEYSNLIGKELYKLDSKKKVRVWKQEVTMGSTGVFIKTTSGLQDGNLTTRIKAVEDSTVLWAEDRAEALVSNKYGKKLREGHYQTVDQALNAGVLRKFMLAYQWDQEKASRLPLMGQPKINGVRAGYDYKKDKLVSKGQLFYTVEHVRKAARAMCEDRGIDNIDGELYIPEFHVGSINSAISHPGTYEHELLEYHVYDYMDEAPFSDRFTKLCKGPAADCIHIVPTVRFKKWEQLQVQYDRWLSQGWEGMMIRNPRASYIHSRCYSLMKWKPVFDKEFPVVGYKYEHRIDPSTNTKMPLVIFVCLAENGKTFDVTPGWDVARRYKWYKDHKGQDVKAVCSELDHLTVEFRERTINGLPFHTVGIEFRKQGT